MKITVTIETGKEHSEAEKPRKYFRKAEIEEIVEYFGGIEPEYKMTRADMRELEDAVRTSTPDTWDRVRKVLERVGYPPKNEREQ